MSFLRVFPLIALLSFLFVSCEEDIDFAGEGQETAVIIGLLNPMDSIHYVKVTRAFGGGNNSLEVAQIPDSNYFANIEVKVEEIQMLSGSGEVIKRTWILDDTLLTNKEDGAFYGPEQKLYYFKAFGSDSLLADEDIKYRLTATVNGGEFVVTGETQLVRNVAITSPSGFSALTFASSDVAVNGYKNSVIKVSGGTANVIDCRLQVTFDEFRSASDSTAKTFTWKLGEVSGGDIASSNSFVAGGQFFYELVAENVTNDPTIIKRELSSIRIIATAGTEDLAKYLLVNQPSTSLAQSKPTFTNLTASDGRRVIGIFSARTTIIQHKAEWLNYPPAYYRAIDVSSVEELCRGTKTGGFAFCSDNPQDIAKIFYCPF